MPRPELQIETQLSLMWAFIVLNFFARDFHELGRPGMLEQMSEGVVNGVVITEPLMLLGGVMIEIPIMMTIFSLFTGSYIGRWANIIAAIFTGAIIVVNNLDPDLDNIFFMIIKILAVIYILRTAWKWQPE